MKLPAQASFDGGRTPRSHGIHINGRPTRRRFPTLATVIKGSGYRTGAFVGRFVSTRASGSAAASRVDDSYTTSDTATFKVTDLAQRIREGGRHCSSAPVPGPPSPDRAPVRLGDLFDRMRTRSPGEYRAGPRPRCEIALHRRERSAGCSTSLARPCLDRTIVVVTADQESRSGPRRTKQGCSNTEDAGVSSLSGASVGRGVVDVPVAHADILPTLLDLVASAPPPNLDGRSVAALAAGDRPLYFEALEANLTRGWAPLTGVVAGDWKYIELPLPELYNLRDDPGEAHNLVDRESARRDVMRRALAQVERHGRSHVPAAVDEDAAARLRSLGTRRAPARRCESSRPATIRSGSCAQRGFNTGRASLRATYEASRVPGAAARAPDFSRPHERRHGVMATDAAD